MLSTMTYTQTSSHLFFFNDTATTEIYTLSLHDALPIYRVGVAEGEDDDGAPHLGAVADAEVRGTVVVLTDRKSTRLNSSHGYISYAVFCLKKKKKNHVVVCLIQLMQTIFF